MVAYHAHADEGAAVSDVVLQLIERSVTSLQLLENSGWKGSGLFLMVGWTM